MSLAVEDLMEFEEQVAELFNAGKIRAPVHLYSGCEQQMIEIFAGIKHDDYVFCTWRSHYQCLLKDVPQARVLEAILEGRSIALCFPEYRVFSSAIVGGTIPMAVGTALGLKRQRRTEKVWCFLGDMAAFTGTAAVSARYANAHDLPITFVVEDNGLSVCTETSTVWKTDAIPPEISKNPKVITYKYKSKYPHAGAGVRVQF
jgi:pyruvate dehydrogenase E1 component alpha subunit